MGFIIPSTDDVLDRILGDDNAPRAAAGAAVGTAAGLGAVGVGAAGLGGLNPGIAYGYMDDAGEMYTPSATAQPKFISRVPGVLREAVLPGEFKKVPGDFIPAPKARFALIPDAVLDTARIDTSLPSSLLAGARYRPWEIEAEHIMDSPGKVVNKIIEGAKNVPGNIRKKKFTSALNGLTLLAGAGILSGVPDQIREVRDRAFRDEVDDALEGGRGSALLAAGLLGAIGAGGAYAAHEYRNQETP